MHNFEQATAVERVDEGCFHAQIHKEWRLWWPAGGYVSALALRAAGAASRFKRPASIAVQYLSMAAFEPVDIRVNVMRRGKRTEALQVVMAQKERPVLTAQVWMVGQGDGMVHDNTKMPDVPGPEGLDDMSTLTNGENGDKGFFANMEQRPVGWIPFGDRMPGEPVVQSWYRFRPRTRSLDPVADATRSLVLIDTFSWLSTYGAHPTTGASPWIAPNLDLYVRFHADTTAHDWLFSEMRSDIAKDGLIGAEGTVWTPEGKLAAAGSTQLFCQPRKPKYQ